MLDKKFENAKRILLTTVMTALCWALPGCQSITPTTTYADIRFIDASPDAPGLDIYQGNTAVVYNMGFTTVTTYVPISPGSYRFTAYTANTKQSQVSTTGSVSNGNQYTVLISNVAASLQETIFLDQSHPAPSGQIDIRVINEATSTSGTPFDLYMIPSGTPLANAKLLATSAFNTIGNYISVATGSYYVLLVPTGTVLTSTTVATYTGTLKAYTSGSAHTVIIVDPPNTVTTPGAQVIITDDYEPPGAVAAQ
jgi:hypothetical protein